MGLLLLGHGCDSESKPGEEDDPEGAETPASPNGAPAPSPVPAPIAAPTVKTPGFENCSEWLVLPQMPAIEGLEPAPEITAGKRWIVVAIPAGEFPTVKQSDRTYAKAIFRDWTMTVENKPPAVPPTGTALCMGAVAGSAKTAGQLALANQRNFNTGKTELSEATLGGGGDTFHLLFLAPAGTPSAICHQKKKKRDCLPAETPELLNRLFLPAKPVSHWVEGKLDLKDAPIQLADFGACATVRRTPELRHLDPQGHSTVQHAPDQRAYLEFHFAARPQPFDFIAHDWHLVMADASQLEAAGVSADGGNSYLLKITEARGYSSQPTTTPVILFEIPAGATPVRLQYKSQSAPLPR